MARKKNRRKNRKKNHMARNSKGQFVGGVSYTAKKKKKKTKNPRKANARKTNWWHRKKNRKKNPPMSDAQKIAVFDKFNDLIPATITGTIGYALGGILNLRNGFSNMIAEQIAGKKDGKQKTPDYTSKAYGRAAVDTLSLVLQWWLTKIKEPNIAKFRTPMLIGASVRLGQSLLDAVLTPNPESVFADIRQVMALPRVKPKTLTAAPGSGMLVSYSPRKKSYIDTAGNTVTMSIKGGVGYSADGKFLIDSESNSLITEEAKGGMGNYEEWDLVLHGPGAGYELGSQYEQWDESMGSQYEQWDESMGSPAPGYELAAYGDDLYGPEAGFEMGSQFEHWDEPEMGYPYEAPY